MENKGDDDNFFLDKLILQDCKFILKEPIKRKN